MKKFGVLSILLLGIVVLNAQQATYDDVVSKRASGVISKYISKDGQSFKMGDTLVLGTPFTNSNYNYITQSPGAMLNNTASGSHVIIHKIKATRGMVIVITTPPDGFHYKLNINNFEGALENNEIWALGYISSERALQLLKNEKDKLDLGVITKEEFEKKKSKLVKYIK